MDSSLYIAWAVATALFTDGFLYGLMIPLSPHLLIYLNESWMLGVMYGGYALGVMLGTPFFGILSDQIGRRKPMLWGVGIQILAVVLFATAKNFPGIFLARVAQGLSAAATWTAGLALIAEKFQKNRAQIMGVGMMANTCGLALGPLVGGVLFERLGFFLSFALMEALLLVDGFLRWSMIRDTQRNFMGKSVFCVEASPVIVPKSCRISTSTLMVLLQDPVVLSSAAIVVLGAWCWSVLEALIPGYLENQLHIPSLKVGAIFTVGSLIYGLSCPWVGLISDRIGSRKTMTGGLVIMAAILPFLAHARTLFDSVFLVALMSIAYGFTLNPILSELGESVDRSGAKAYATVYVIYNLAYALGMLLSNFSASALSALFSLSTALFFVGGVVVLAIPFVRKTI